MKLKQVVIDKTELTLTKEKKQIKYGEIFEVSDLRGSEILKATFKDKPVAELVKESSVEPVAEPTEIIRESSIEPVAEPIKNNKPKKGGKK